MSRNSMSRNFMSPGRARALVRQPMVRVAAIFVILAILMTATATVAQSPVYDLFTRAGEQSDRTRPEPRQSRPEQPLPGVSGSGFQTTGPSAADYARIASTVPDPMLDATGQAIGVFRGRAKAMVDRLPAAWRDIRIALAAASPTGMPGYFLGVALFAGILLILGRGFTVLFAVYVGRPLMLSIQRNGRPRVGYLGKLPLLACRLLLSVVGAAITVTVAASVGLVFYQEHRPTLTTVIIVFAAYALILVVDTIWRMALAPYLPEYRLPHLSNRDAARIYRRISAVSAFTLASMAFCYWIQALGLATEVHIAITLLLSLAAILLLILTVRVHRRAISGIILVGKPRDRANWLQLIGATLWAPTLVLYLLFTWGDMSFRMIMGIDQSPFRLAAPYMIFVVGLVIYALASYVIERIFARSREISAVNAGFDARRDAEDAAFRARIHDDAARVADAADADAQIDSDAEGDDDGGSAARPIRIPPARRPGMRTLKDLAHRGASLFAIGAVAYALIRHWAGPEVFQRVPGLDLLQDVVDILFVGYLAFHAVRIWIDTKIAEEAGDEEPQEILEGEGGTGATRLATLLPLVRNFLLAVIAVTVALLVVMEMGVNVAPLFAGAGIVGLAIGFGAQTLVRDIIAGAFFLMDDAFRKGEYIDVGTVKGTVEKISLRSFQLRHHLGALHTIPFGEMQYLTNFSRDWVMMKLPLRLTYDTDVERVRKLVKKLGIRLAEDPEIGRKFIQPLKSQGVIQMDDSAMIVRVKFMTMPGEQWVLRKRIYAEIRELFEKEGIEFAHRQVTVRIPGIDERKGPLSQEQMKAVGAAARRVGDDEREAAAATGTAGDTR